MTTNITTMKSSSMVSSPTLFLQSRVPATVDGAPKYKVTNFVQSQGQLPDVSIFVLTIVDTGDVSQDVLARVATPPDFFSYSSSRAAAISNGQTLYRSSSWIQLYDSIDVAVAGAKVFKDRVDALVQDWMVFAYQFQFGPPGELFILPSSDSTTLASLIDAWLAAHSATATALLAKNQQDATVSASQTTVTSATTNYNTMISLQNAINSAKTQSDALNAFITSGASACAKLGDEPSPSFPQALGSGTGFWLALNNLVETIDTTGSVPAAVTTARNTFVSSSGVPILEQIDSTLCVTGLPAARAAYVDLSTSVSAATGAVAAAGAALTAANTALDAAKSAQIVTNAVYNKAVLDEASALSSVKSACPDFDPSNPSASLAK